MSELRRAMKSYGDALRLFNNVMDLIEKAERSNYWRDLAREALIEALQAIVLLVGGGYRPPADPTYLAAQALEEGAIDDSLYSKVVEANLALNGYSGGGKEFVLGVIRALLLKASEIDAYLSQQMNLYRY